MMFAIAEWTAGDLAWAVDHYPDGRPHRHPTRTIRHPAGWLRWRLSHWLEPCGAPLRPRRSPHGQRRT